jgi:hypothetical protein
MEITTTHELLLEKLTAQVTLNVLASLSQNDLTPEEVDASMVLNKRNIDRDAKAIADLVFASFTPAE